MNEKIILDAINQIQVEAFWLFLKLIAAGVIFLMIKAFVEKVVAYLQFRWDKDLGVGVKVFARGQEGTITDFNLSCIYISCNDRVIIIRTRRWLFEKIDLVHQDAKDDKKI